PNNPRVGHGLSGLRPRLIGRQRLGRAVAHCRWSVILCWPTVVAGGRPWSAADGHPTRVAALSCHDISPPFQGRGLSRPGVGLVVDLPIPGSTSWRCPSLPPHPILGFAAVGRFFLGAVLPILGLASRHCPSLPLPPILGFIAVGQSFHWFLAAHPSSSRFAGGRRRPRHIGHRPYHWPYLYRLPYSIGSSRSCILPVLSD